MTYTKKCVLKTLPLVYPNLPANGNNNKAHYRFCLL